MNIREYSDNDFPVVQGFMIKLLDYLVDIDPMKRMRRADEYGVKYTEKLLEKIKKMEGMIFLAENETEVVGLIAGVVEKQDSEHLLVCVRTNPGRVLELIVDEKYRGQNVGAMLMKKMEEYLTQKGCDALRVEVFCPNKSAIDFYRELGYEDRMVDMIKMVK